MKKETIQRFTRPELWWHWSQAALYLLLFGSGTLLLIGRIFDHPFVSPAVLGKLHRMAGIALVALLCQILLLSMVADNFRSLWRTLGQCLRWRWSDVVWLIKVPFNAVTRRVTLPPADRFNAGQKLHVLAVVCALAGFSISGLLMMLVPGALGPWIIHLICFLPAAAFLVLHLFLSLLNPQTRQTLPAIFSGHMSLELARQHHGLWAGPSDSREHSSYVSVGVVLTVAALAIAGAGVFTVSYGPKRTVNLIGTAMAHGGMNALSPAPLSKAHAHRASNAQGCATCHALTASPPSEKCLVCHTRIGERRAAGSGFHGKLSGPCRQCHTEHKGGEATLVSLDRETFNHRNTTFPLDGRHQSVPCERCHARKTRSDTPGRMRYAGLDHRSCTSCHHDPHNDPRAGHCLECHTMQGWRREHLTFDHSRDSGFPLTGKHAKLDCQQCHPRLVINDRVQVRLFDVGKSCQDCHADPHRGQFKETCSQCHTEQGWTGRRRPSFHASGSSFPLKGKHANVRCDQCHHIPENGHRLADAQFTGLSHDCQSCHTDPHAGQMSSACSTCHTETGWTGNNLLFSHDKHTSFPLDGLHSMLSCDDCHGQKAKRYRPLPHECGTCHIVQQAALQGMSQTRSGSPDPHSGRLSCTDCHNLSAPRQRQEAFAAQCAACHNSRYGALFYSWANALDQSSMAIKQVLRRTDDPNDPRRLQLEQILEDAAVVGFHNLTLAREILRAGSPAHPENVK
jgi:cytochrome b subunit of formate dehydrogenase